MRKSIAVTAFAVLFILPFFGWIAAEPALFTDAAGGYSLTPPDGWALDDSGHMGPGVLMKGPAAKGGPAPAIQLLYQPAGIVTLDVQWHTMLGQLRYEMTRVKFLSLQEVDDAPVPYRQAAYTYRDGDVPYRALTRLYLAGGRFYHLTATAPEGAYAALEGLFTGVFDSLRITASP